MQDTARRVARAWYVTPCAPGIEITMPHFSGVFVGVLKGKGQHRKYRYCKNSFLSPSGKPLVSSPCVSPDSRNLRLLCCDCNTYLMPWRLLLCFQTCPTPRLHVHSIVSRDVAEAVLTLLPSLAVSKALWWCPLQEHMLKQLTLPATSDSAAVMSHWKQIIKTYIAIWQPSPND